jgi:hypothetical protein
MADKEVLHAVASKALADPQFRQKLLDDPETALEEAGIELDEEQVKALKEMDREQLEQGLGELDQRLSMGCWSRNVQTAPVPIPDKSGSEGLPVPIPKIWD